MTKSKPVITVTDTEINNNKIHISFTNQDSKSLTKIYLIIEEESKQQITQLIELTDPQYIFSTMKKLSEAGLVIDRKSLEEELGL